MSIHIRTLRSDHIYNRLINVPQQDKQEMFRTELLSPFMGKWEKQQIPFRASAPGGFDVLTLNSMINRSPEQITEEIAGEIALISGEQFWSECEAAVNQSLTTFEEQGVDLKVSDYVFTIQLGNPQSPTLMLSEGYSGDGGIPGYILCTLVPNDYTLPRIKSALAHECNHNVRYQFIKWDYTVTLGELIVSEGLAESFATSLYGEQWLGPWVTKTSKEVLQQHIKPVLREKLQLTGFDKIVPYLYGDEVARLQGFEPASMPYSAGYACGYYLIQYYLKKTGKTIVEATTLPASQILGEIEGFWDEETMVSSQGHGENNGHHDSDATIL